jgi:hypothetical protein
MAKALMVSASRASGMETLQGSGKVRSVGRLFLEKKPWTGTRFVLKIQE